MEGQPTSRPAKSVINRPLVLKSHGGDEGGEEYIVVNRSPFSVGRRQDNDSQIARPDVSAKHAVLCFQNGAWYVVDKESTNGTFVNGKRISQPVMLRSGDVLYFATKGYHVVQRVMSVQESSEPTRIIGDSSEIRGALDLINIIDKQRTYPYFQPIQTIDRRETVGWEALGRAQAHDGMVTAGSLYFLAERAKVEATLSARFRDSAQVCAECRHCWTSPVGRYLFINVHPAELRDARPLQWLDQYCQAEIAQLYRLVVEIPESHVCNTEEMQTLVSEIHARGLKVAYDDFGRGQSRIADLISVPPDFLKLDRELIGSLGLNPVKHSLVKAIVAACRDLNVSTIGEGIENEEELAACQAIGIEYGQGYFLGRPASAYDLFGADRSTLPDICPYVKLGITKDIVGQIST
jgi:EAL domain-containing protein (putative c-di-GMP-specific phosphodiesterase class I)